MKKWLVVALAVIGSVQAGTLPYDAVQMQFRPLTRNAFDVFTGDQLLGSGMLAWECGNFPEYRLLDGDGVLSAKAVMLNKSSGVYFAVSDADDYPIGAIRQRGNRFDLLSADGGMIGVVSLNFCGTKYYIRNAQGETVVTVSRPSCASDKWSITTYPGYNGIDASLVYTIVAYAMNTSQG